MSEFLRTFTGRVVDDIPLSEYLAGSSTSATFKTTISDQPAVVKLFAPDSADAQLARLQLTEKLSHPHLLRTLRTGRAELDGTAVVYIVTEFAEENLAQVLHERALTAAEAREVLQSTLDALSYLHAQGMVHADLKPANIMAIGDQLKLSVDGVRRIGEPLDRELGPYDAPEAPQKLSPASDIWSLGITLVEVLTQQMPPKSTSDATGPAVPESVPAPFREIAQHCLLRTPELRWNIADIPAKLNSQAPAPPAPARVDAPPRPIPAPRPTSKRPFILLAIVAAIVIAIVVFSRTPEHKPPVPTSTESPAPAQQPAPAPETTTADTSASETTTPATSTKVERPEPVRQAADELTADNAADTDTTSGPDTPAAASSPGVVRQVMPQVIRRAQNSIHGKVRVKLKVEVDASGNVVDTSFISRGPSNYFARVSEEAARRWKFEPSSTEARAWNIEFDFRRGGTQVHSTPAR